MIKGDIILLPFPFSDQKGSKLRPAVVLFSLGLDVTVCLITTELKWKSACDLVVNPSPQNGLKAKSLIRFGKITTIDKELIYGKLGNLQSGEIESLNEGLRRLLKL
ncbi:MAG: type II toxin-antitoxin system PemK/MazF family toxin [Bacteroidales bacterium]